MLKSFSHDQQIHLAFSLNSIAMFQWSIPSAFHPVELSANSTFDLGLSQESIEQSSIHSLL